MKLIIIKCKNKVVPEKFYIQMHFDNIYKLMSELFSHEEITEKSYIHYLEISKSDYYNKLLNFEMIENEETIKLTITPKYIKLN